MERREFLTSMCGLGVAALFPWAWFAEVRSPIVTGTTVVPYDDSLGPPRPLVGEIGHTEGLRWVEYDLS